MSTPVSVAILAAGLGTRMKSRRAKVLHRAGGRCLVEHVVNAALAIAPPGRIVAVTGYQAGDVEALLAPSGIRFARQTEQKGTGHAVMACRDLLADLEGYLVILYGDCPLLAPSTLARLVDRHRASAPAATVITTLPDDPTGYGRILRAADGGVEAIIEQKAATPQQKAIREINSGIYCFDAPLLWRHIGEITPDNPAREYYLTDIVAILNRAGHRVEPLPTADPLEVLGINHRIELAEADRALRERKTRALMLDGVTIERPETVTVDPDVEIGIDTVVEPFARLLGRTRIGEDCRIGAGSILEDATVEDGATIEPYTWMKSAIVGSGSRVGPYARLREGSVVCPGAAVGNFVELKKTTLGPGSKAMHLTYLGDAAIGASVNIGAGTIICNYDGTRKHPTAIGDRAFVGSNTTLVAPVELGPESYVAAGSVITEPVPPGSLALARSRQTVKPGWVAKRKRETDSRSETAPDSAVPSTDPARRHG